MEAKTLRVDIYKSSMGSCSNHGISEFNDEIILLLDDGDVPEHLKDEPILCKIVRRNLPRGEYIHIEPVRSPRAGHNGWMYGGCIVDTSNAPFHEATGISYAINLHDRQEAFNS